MLVLHVLLSSPNLKIPSILSKLLGSLQSQIRWPKILAATDSNGQTSLHIAAAYNANLLQWLFSNPDTIKAILNQQTHDGKTALMKAAEEGNLKSVDLLLSNSADITVQDRSGYTAYDLAARNGYTDVTNLISEYAKAKNISNFANTYKN
jgi:ankyrin repeat protein